MGLHGVEQSISCRREVTEVIYHFDPKIQHTQHRLAQALLSEHLEHQRQLREVVQEVARHHGLRSIPEPRQQSADPLHDHILEGLVQHVRAQASSGVAVVYSLRPPQKMTGLASTSAAQMWTSLSHHSLPVTAVRGAPPDAAEVEDDSGLVSTRDKQLHSQHYEGVVHFQVVDAHPSRKKLLHVAPACNALSPYSMIVATHARLTASTHWSQQKEIILASDIGSDAVKSDRLFSLISTLSSGVCSCAVPIRDQKETVSKIDGLKKFLGEKRL